MSLKASPLVKEIARDEDGAGLRKFEEQHAVPRRVTRRFEDANCPVPEHIAVFVEGFNFGVVEGCDQRSFYTF